MSSRFGRGWGACPQLLNSTGEQRVAGRPLSVAFWSDAGSVVTAVAARVWA